MKSVCAALVVLAVSATWASAQPAEIASVSLAAIAITDDGTADPVCIAGDPDPGNDPVVPEPCPGRTNAECDSPGSPGSGICANVPDGYVDPGEVASVRLTVANHTLDSLGAPRSLANATLGLYSSSATVGCVLTGQVFVGALPTTGTVTTPAGALRFIASPSTSQSFPGSFAAAHFVVTVAADGIQGNSPEQAFDVTLDRDIHPAPRIANACGGSKLGGGFTGGHLAEPGALCEDFETDRNGDAAISWTRLAPAPDPNDDILGRAAGGGAAPLGVSGGLCSSNAAHSIDLAHEEHCVVVPDENDWHLHSPFEGCGDGYDARAGFASSCAPDGGKAHSGFRSMHLGRHTDPGSTLGDTYRFRQTSAFVADPVNLGTSSKLDFWQILSFCDDKCLNVGSGATTGGGQVQISLRDAASGAWGGWRRLAAAENGYQSLESPQAPFCTFDPGDDQEPPVDETFCERMDWSDEGDPYGSDLTCVTDTDGTDPIDRDCGSTTNRTVDPACSWIADPACGSFLEHGDLGAGVWARSSFDLASFAGQEARLRWVVQTGGGWGFGQDRSFLEPEPGGSPLQMNDMDDGWYIDDIKLTDLRVAASAIDPDPSDGLSVCPSRGDPDNCGEITLRVAGSAVDARTGGTVLRAPSGAAGTEVTLDARRSTAGPSGQECLVGLLEYQWSALDATGAVSQVVAPFSPDGEAVVAPTDDADYLLESRCSSDLSCAAAATIRVEVYPGDGSDLTNSDLDAGGEPLDGLRIDHDLVTNVATLRWRARPQVPGVSGYDLFKRDYDPNGIRGVCSGTAPGSTCGAPSDCSMIGQPCEGGTPFAANAQCNQAHADVFCGAVFKGSACFANAVPQGAAGAELSRTDAAMPAPRHASLYMVGHSSTNAAAIAPLGFRPATSTRPGALVTASGSCP